MSTLINSLKPTSEGYDQLRRRFFNGRVPDIYPAEIVTPTTTAEVVAAVQTARKNGWKISVRSGGHLLFCSSLREGGLLIDTQNLNKNIEFNTATKIATISPGHRVVDLAEYFRSIGRFFPAGHSRTVAVGGFLLAGGQGLFMRGWGYTAASWVTQLEVVTSDGEVVIANKEENADLFWAAPGSGQGFFGVVTRIWVRTIPTKKLFDKTIILDSTDIFKPLFKRVLEISRIFPKYGVELFYCTFYADRDDPNGGHQSASKRVFFVINESIFADSIEEADFLTRPWDAISKEFESHIVNVVPTQQRTYEEFWDLQERFQPEGNGERYNVDSALVDPKATDDEIVEALTPALYDLPSRLSQGTYCPIDYHPDEKDQALSLPQIAYASTMCCWTDPEQDVAVDKWLNGAYEKADGVSVGVYVADFNSQPRRPKVMTDSALKKWLEIRDKWDPSETFIGHRGFIDLQMLPELLRSPEETQSHVARADMRRLVEHLRYNVAE